MIWVTCSISSDWPGIPQCWTFPPAVGLKTLQMWPKQNKWQSLEIRALVWCHLMKCVSVAGCSLFPICTRLNIWMWHQTDCARSVFRIHTTWSQADHCGLFQCLLVVMKSKTHSDIRTWTAPDETSKSVHGCSLPAQTNTHYHNKHLVPLEFLSSFLYNTSHR